MTTTSHKNYVVVSKTISKFDITHDIKYKNINILISIIYDMINGNTTKYYINNQDEAEKECINENRFSKKFKNCIGQFSSEEINSIKNNPNLNPK
ncbi:hypothetical protein LEJ48_03210 [Salmonella enterica]|nr:hypothetical protein [Salmonella enterica]